jgi:hypothetical protein
MATTNLRRRKLVARAAMMVLSAARRDGHEAALRQKKQRDWGSDGSVAGNTLA